MIGDSVIYDGTWHPLGRDRAFGVFQRHGGREDLRAHLHYDHRYDDCPDVPLSSAVPQLGARLGLLRPEGPVRLARARRLRRRHRDARRRRVF